MRKLLTILVMGGAVCVAPGQGSVNFATGATLALRISTNSVVGGAATGQTGAASGGYNYYYALFVADSTVTSAGTRGPYGALDPTLTPGWSQAMWAGGNPAGVVGAIYATNTILGRLQGNPTTDDALISGRATGTVASFVVVGWSAEVAGMDWASAKTWIDLSLQTGGVPTIGWTGASSVATTVQLGGGVIPPGTIFGTLGGQAPGFTLQIQPIPEPSAFALAGLGAAVVLALRRRKAKPARLRL